MFKRVLGYKTLWVALVFIGTGRSAQFHACRIRGQRTPDSRADPTVFHACDRRGVLAGAGHYRCATHPAPAFRSP